MAKRPWPCTLTIDASVASSAIWALSTSLAVARIDRSELHSTTSMRRGPSPCNCMISAPLNFRLADSSAAAAIISPNNVRTGAG